MKWRNSAARSHRDPDQGNAASERRWTTIAYLRYSPPFIKSYAQHRRRLIHAEDTARQVMQSRRKSDVTENRDTRLPNEEHVRVRCVWVTELYTPTTLAGLLRGLPPLLAQTIPDARDAKELLGWIRASRRRGNSEQRQLVVRPPGTKPSWDDRNIIVDDLPHGITSVRIYICTLTSTVTAVSAEFMLDDKYSQELEEMINRDVPSRVSAAPIKGFPGSSWRTRTPFQVKQEAADQWRARLRSDAARWLAGWLPGSFHRLSAGHPPTIELLLTEQHRAWAGRAADGSLIPKWTQALRLEGDYLESRPMEGYDLVSLVRYDGYWQSTDDPPLRLQGQLFDSSDPVLTLAALRSEFFSDGPAGFNRDGLSFASYILPFANRWAVTAFLSELDEQLATTRDLVDRASLRRSPNALSQIQQQLIHTGMDSNIVATDIVRRAQDEKAWLQMFPGFSKVVVQDPAHQTTAQMPLAEVLRQSQIDVGGRLKQAEADLRELLTISAELTAAAENLRLQRRVLWLTIASLIVAIIAALAAVAALRGL